MEILWAEKERTLLQINSLTSDLEYFKIEEKCVSERVQLCTLSYLRMEIPNIVESYSQKFRTRG